MLPRRRLIPTLIGLFLLAPGLARAEGRNGKPIPDLAKLHLGKEQYVEFKSQAADFPVLPLTTKEKKP